MKRIAFHRGRRRRSLTVTVTTVCADDYNAAKSLAAALREIGGRNVVVHGLPPYYRRDEIYYPAGNFGRNLVRATYVVRFRWWHWLVPARYVR